MFFLKNKPYTAINKEEFNKFILSAIQEINKEETIATINKIKIYFRQTKISPITSFGPKINKEYLNSLVEHKLLDTKKVKLSQNGNREVTVYFTTIKAGSIIMNNEEKEAVLEQPEHQMEVDLIECPNPDCRYTCHSSWTACPICEAELLSNRFCKVCGDNFKHEEEGSYVCKKCYDLGFNAGTKMRFCPNCGEDIFNKEKFCITCYFSFILPTTEFKTLSLDKLFTFSVRFERFSKYLVIFTIQLSFIIFLIADFLQFYNPEFKYNISNTIIIFLFLSCLIIYLQIKYRRIKKARIARDKLYRIKLAIIHYKLDLAEKANDEKLKKLQNIFRNVNSDIRESFKKIRIWHKILNLCKSIIIILLVLSVITILFFNYILSIIFIIIALSFTYLIVSKIKINYINKIFRLGSYFNEMFYENFIIYAINLLNYL